MNAKEQVVFELKNLGSALRENRWRVANKILNNPNLFPCLIEILFSNKKDISIKAAWVMEFILAKNLTLIIPHLSVFTANLATISYDSSARCCAKICNFLATAYNEKKDTCGQHKLKIKHINLIVETCFDWLITPHKVAVKVFCMSTLFEFGKRQKWIHKELKLVLQQNTAYESAAYKARSKKILALINKNNS